MPTTRSPEAASRTRIDHPAERLVAQHQPVLARRRPAVLALGDLRVGAAHANCHGLDQHRPVTLVRLGSVLVVGAARLLRLDGDRLHAQGLLFFRIGPLAF
jgi:hypothetical protein